MTNRVARARADIDDNNNDDVGAVDVIDRGGQTQY